MKKYILPFMSIAMLMAMASCSSSDDEVAEIKEESKLVPMTFTATQESNAGTRSALDNNNVIWKSGDKISVFDGTGADHNQQFTLQGTEGTTSGSFSGTASETATSYTAVYPYTSGAQLESDGKVSGIELPAEQTATLNSFDPAAALMMAVSTEENKNSLEFKNAVSLIKIETEFACKKIVLSANEYIAGTGKLSYNIDAPSITFDSGQSNTITLKPASEGGKIEIGTYYIVVPSITMTGFSISFDASDEYCVYTRTSTKSNTFNRSKIKDLGTFKTDGTWTHTSRGKVNKNDEVDMGVFEIGGIDYRLIFTKSNLTENGLAENEYDYGDYFAWGATEPWYSSISGNTFTWKDGKSDGYSTANAPYYNNGSYTKYTSDGEILKAADDAANVILGGDWQLPTKKIWQALSVASMFEWGKGGNKQLETIVGSTIKGMKITKIDDPSTYLFLPAAGYVNGTSFDDVGTNGYYWSGTAGSSTNAYRLHFNSGNVYAQSSNGRYFGFSVRPVRLVAAN